MIRSDFVEDKEYKVKLNITIDKDIKELLQHSSVKTTQDYISLNRLYYNRIVKISLHYLLFYLFYI